MTLIAPYAPTFHIADGNTGTFLYSFVSNNIDSIKVLIRTDVGGIETKPFTVNTENGRMIGSISFGGDYIPESGTQIVIYRETNQAQDVDFITSSGFNAKVVESLFDKLTALAQESEDIKNSTVSLNPFQRNIAIDFLVGNQTMIYWDSETNTFKETDYVQNDVVQASGGMYLRQTTSGDTSSLQYSLNGTDWYNAIVFSAAQTAALNSGITADGVAQITTNKTNIATLDANKANATEVSAALALKADKSDTYTKDEVDAIADEKANTSDMTTALAGKVDKVEGKELSSNDYTDTDKAQLATNTTGIAALAATSATHTSQIAALDSEKADVSSVYTKAETDAIAADKLDKNLGSSLSGQYLTVGADGNITTTASGGGGGGLSAVAHDDTLTGAGTDDDQLGVASSITTAISTNTTNIATNTAGIATNATNISTNTANIATNAANITELQTESLSQDGRITTNTTAIAGLDETVEGYGESIESLDSDMATVQETLTHISTEATPSTIPRSNTAGKLNAGWIPIASDDTFATGTTTTEVPNVAQVHNALDGITSLQAGSLISSTVPLTDAGLHSPDGTLLSGSGSYAAFVAYMADKSAGDNFCTEAEWQASVASVGTCGKYVYDSTANTLRLPKTINENRKLIKSYVDGTGWYKIFEEAQVDGTVKYWCEQGGRATLSDDYTMYLLYPFTNDVYTIQGEAIGVDAIDNLGVTTKYSDRIVGNHHGASTNTFEWNAEGYCNAPDDYQGQTIYEYIVVGTVVKTDVEVDIDNVTADLAGKADADLSNATVLVETIAEEYSNGTEWYIIYKRPQSDGTVKYWCEQGGYKTLSSDDATTITLLVSYNNTDYFATTIQIDSSNVDKYALKVSAKNTSTLLFSNTGSSSKNTNWMACGYCDAPVTETEQG